MPDEPADELIGLVADERMLTEDPASLPATVGHPRAIPIRAGRSRIVGFGVTMTAVTLISGVILAIGGAIELLFADGGVGAIVALVLGLLLASTHWGWAHVAEIAAEGFEQRGNAGIVAERQAWLGAIGPFTRYEVITAAADDGSITIERVRHRPIRRSDRTFVFARDTELREVHSGEEPAAVISERAELLRRQAAADTERERARFQAAADAFENAALTESDDRERLHVQAAASRALSEQINANLREPPLVE
jgi:hypothetical protein